MHNLINLSNKKILSIEKISTHRSPLSKLHQKVQKQKSLSLKILEPENNTQHRGAAYIGIYRSDSHTDAHAYINTARESRLCSGRVFPRSGIHIYTYCSERRLCMQCSACRFPRLRRRVLLLSQARVKALSQQSR